MRLESWWPWRRSTSVPAFITHRGFSLPTRWPLTRTDLSFTVLSYPLVHGGESYARCTGSMQQGPKEQHLLCTTGKSFLFLIFTTKEFVFIFSDEDIKFMGNLFAFILGKGGGRKSGLPLNDPIKYFSTTASELSVCTGHGKESSTDGAMFLPTGWTLPKDKWRGFMNSQAFYGTRDGSQSLTHARQGVYH